jgi:hypothetical protein
VESAKITTPALPSDSAIAYIAATLATSIAVGGDVGEHRCPSTGPGLGPECQADDHDAFLGCRLHPAFCSTASKPPTMMPFGFSATAWLKAPSTGPRRALAVDDAIVPADRGGGFLDALGDAENAAVAHVAGDIDHGLAGRPPSARGRAVPLVGAAGGLGDDGLGLVEERRRHAGWRSARSPGRRRWQPASSRYRIIVHSPFWFLLV